MFLLPARDPAKQLAAELADLRREVRSGSRGSQMSFRSLENGAIPVYDADGNQTGQIGVLPDGTTGVQVTDGPKPVAPSAPILLPLIGGLEITWDGTTFDGSPLPGDFRAVEIHASPYSVYTPDATTLRANIIAPGTVTLGLPDQPWTIIFVIRATSGQRSDPSISATETPEHAPTAAEVTDARQAASDAQADARNANQAALDAAGLAAKKGKVYFQASAPVGDPNGLWIDSDDGNKPYTWNGSTWVVSQDTGIKAAADAAGKAQSTADAATKAAQDAQTAAANAMTKATSAQTSADGKNRVFWRPLASPPPTPLIDGDIWFVTDKGNLPRIYKSGAWADAALGDNAISGLNVGKLVAGQIAVGQRIIAGETTGTHAQMSDDGFRVFLEDTTGDGQPDEVVRMGTQDDDIIGISDRNGILLASIDSTGSINAQELNITGEARFGGARLQELIGAASGSGNAGGIGPKGAANTWGFNTGALQNGIVTEFGLIELPVYADAGRMYWLAMETAFRLNDAAGEMTLRIRDGGGNSPTINSPTVMLRRFNGSYLGYNNNAFAAGLWQPTSTGTHRLLLTAEKSPGAQGTIDITNGDGGPAAPTITVLDLGPSKPINAGVNRGGGNLPQQSAPPPPPPATQQYYVDLGPSGDRGGRIAWGGNNNVIGNGTDVYQGYESYNGNTKGMFWFDLPNITGNVDRVDVYIYFRHWWFNSGGRVLMNISDQRGVNANFYKFKGDWEPNVTVPKPGSLTVTVPSDWWSLFRGTNNDSYNGRATCITLGPGPGTNQNYYGVATDARLRIWYTQ